MTLSNGKKAIIGAVLLAVSVAIVFVTWWWGGESFKATWWLAVVAGVPGAAGLGMLGWAGVSKWKETRPLGRGRTERKTKLSITDCLGPEHRNFN